jgi:hypothetical protein
LSFLTCCHDGGRGCRSVVLRGNHHCDVAVVRLSRPSSLLGSSEDHLRAQTGRFLDSLHMVQL